MTAVPETHYTRSADGTNLAYQVSGNGPLDLLFVHGAAIPVDLLSEDPGFLRLRKRLASFSRTVWFEARGMGASEGDARTQPGRRRGLPSMVRTLGPIYRWPRSGR
jgi:hypothetical protein